MQIINSTEQNSYYNDLEKMSLVDILTNINIEEQKVALEVQKSIVDIQRFVESVVPKMKLGGRLFYIGAGTSGRLGVLDASECPPTFGVSSELIIGIIAGGDVALKGAIEFAEDDFLSGRTDLDQFSPTELDSILGITASGSTPYVLGAIEFANDIGMTTGCVTCNKNTPLANISKFPIEVIVGPEFITGSTRMKAGTAQKMILNMISTSIMIQLGRVEDNKMVDMQLTNNKLLDRATKIIQNKLSISYELANELLTRYGSVRVAIDRYNIKQNDN